jgi:hypothetical protein
VLGSTLALALAGSGKRRVQNFTFKNKT